MALPKIPKLYITVFFQELNITLLLSKDVAQYEMLIKLEQLIKLFPNIGVYIYIYTLFNNVIEIE